MTHALRRSAPYVVATLPTPPAPPWIAVLEGLPLAAWVVSLADRCVVAANAQACALLGRPLDELLDAPAASLLATPEDLSYWDGLNEQSPASLHTQALLCGPDGRLLHVERSIRPVTVPGAAAASHLLVSLRDRSAEQQAGDASEAAAAELRATLEATADGILVTDLAGRIRSFNHRFAQLWGMPEALLEARDDAKVHDWMRRSVDDPEAYQRRLTAIQDAALLSSSEQLRLHAGQVLERVSRPRLQLPRPDAPARRRPPHRAALHHRRVDRAAQPQPAVGARARSGRAIAPRRRGLRADADRPRPLPPDQRQPGPWRRRRGAAHRGAAHPGLPAHQ
jgi:PAS domain-containing protein